MRVVVSLLRPSVPKIRHTTDEEEVGTGEKAALRGAVSGNASDGSTSAETLVKGK